MTASEKAILAGQREILLALANLASNQNDIGSLATATNCRATADHIQNFILLNEDE